MTLTVGIAVSAENEYDQIESKARRFFDNREWASANAMYLLMLEEKPDIAGTYAHAVVAEMMLGDSLQALEMIPRSMENKVPFDSLLTKVRDVSFSIGKGNLYEDYLLKIKAKYDWLSRVADNYLMHYYAFRQNGPQLIAYAEMMLAGLPDNLTFLRMLAYGELIDGNTDGAIGTWKKIIELYPDDYDTILDLANCYEALGVNNEAQVWWKKAAAIKETPYIKSKLEPVRQ